jgi:kumamolisin
MSDSPFEYRVALAGSQRQSPPIEAKVVGSIAPNELIELSIVLHPEKGVDEQEVYNRAIAGLPPLSHEEAVARLSASDAAMEQVKDFVRAQGLMVDEEKTSAQSRVVAVKGTAQAIAAAFGVQLQRYERDGVLFRGRTGPVYIPREFDGIIAGIFGIDDRPQVHTSAVRPLVASYTAPQVARYYEFPTTVNGTGQCVAIIELGGGYRASDLQAACNAQRLPMPRVVAVSIGGASNRPGVDIGADEEVALDIQMVATVAPGATIVVYFAPNSDVGFLHAILAAVNDATYHPSVISISWGQYESGWTRQALISLNLAFYQAALLGITVCCAVGDSGARDSGSAPLNVDFPSSSPYVLACGGTRLITSSIAAAQELVWNDGVQSATGGGMSTVFARPIWQSAVAIPRQTGRGVPDVAGNADPQTGYQIFVNGQALIIGGTSAVAPLWAGLIALFNQALKRRVGYVNPVLYQRIDHTGTFHDITIGNNNGYTAAHSWDFCTGWGTPRGLPLLNALRAVLQ